MTPERWQQVKAVLASALERAPKERRAYLDQACTEPELRREVESLLAAQDGGDASFLEHPAVASGEALSSGAKLGPYEILGRLGSGGMGVVYRARDSRLEREVAIKVLPSGWLADEAARRRFHKEALALAKLNHPNIAAVYDVGEQGGMDYLVMECVPGHSLAEEIRSRPLREKEVVGLAAQITAALEEAHEQGILHRDLKPENIMVTPKRQAKVLDFGLAKMVRQVANAAAAEASTESLTQQVAGTLPYMAPEQLRGEPADARTDIHALGAVLFEMATGKRPYQGDSGPQLIDAILHQVPVAPRALNAQTSPELERITLKCLEKEPENRYQSAKEIVVDLRRLNAPSALTAAAARPARRRLRRWLWAAGAGGLLVLAAVLYLLRDRPAVDSIAVLPFASAGADPNSEYVSDGLSEQLINALTQLPKLRVIARTTAFAYKGKPVDLTQLGKELRVRTALLGRVLQQGDSLTVQVDLVSTEDGAELWGQQFRRNATDLQAVEEEIARQVTGKLRLRLSGAEQERLAKRYTENPEAYNLYLQGRYLLDSSDVDAGVKSRAYFERAIAKDLNYALAHAGLADSYTYAWIADLEPPDRAIPKAREEARKAIQIDGSAGEGHISLGILKLLHDWDWAGAEQELRLGGELSPNSPYLRHWYAHYLEITGRLPEANARMVEVLDTDPLSPMILEDVYLEYMWMHQWDQALGVAQRLAPLNPDDASALYWRPTLYERLGRHEEALGALKKLRAAPGFFPSVFVGVSLARMGRRDEAKKVLAGLNEMAKKGQCPDYVAVAYLSFALGDRDQGFAFLDESYAARDQGINRMDLAFMNPIWWLEDSRHDPRFAALLKKMGSPAANIH
jgi:serine/threonine-protein kinase